jgi:hypothetical protein
MALLELEDPNQPTVLQFNVEGPVFEAGIPVPLLVEALGNVQGLLDKSYLGLIGKRRLTKDERQRFHLRTSGVSHASLHTDLGVIYTGAQLALPLIGVLGPNGVWEYAKQAYELAKLVFKSVKKGQTVTYTWNADKSVVHVNTGTQTQVFNGPVYNIASLSLPHYQGLATLGEPGEVTEVRLGQRDRREIEFLPRERELFELPTRIENLPYKLECEVFEFDKIDRDGRLRVLPGEPIPEGDYRFEVVGKQSVASYIEAMLQKVVRVTCLREIAENPISGEKIYRLQVVDIET